MTCPLYTDCPCCRHKESLGSPGGPPSWLCSLQRKICPTLALETRSAGLRRGSFPTAVREPADSVFGDDEEWPMDDGHCHGCLNDEEELPKTASSRENSRQEAAPVVFAVAVVFACYRLRLSSKVNDFAGCLA